MITGVVVEFCRFRHFYSELLQMSKQNKKSLRTKFNKEDGLKRLLKNFEVIADLKTMLENLRHQIGREKWIEIEKLVKKKDAAAKKYRMMFQGLVGDDKKKCGINEKLRVKELKKEIADSVKLVSLLKLCLKEFERREAQLQYKVEKLHKQIQSLRFHLWLRTSYLSKSPAERDAVLAYLSNSFFQTVFEDDFLNESSLAEIHNGATREDVCGESRLRELRGRNTPSHSFPVKKA